MFVSFDGRESAFKKGDNFNRYMSDIRSYGVMSKGEFDENYRKYKENGDKAAFDKIICGNLLYAVKFASRFIGSGIAYDDLVETCNEGLIDALKKYDKSKGAFLPYVNYFMMNKLTEERKRNYPVRLPTEVYDNVHRRGHSLSEYATFKSIDKRDDERDDTPFDVGNQDDALSPDRTFKYDKLYLEIDRILSEKEKYVIKNYYGIGCEEKNFNDIAREMGFSHQYISMIYKESIKKLQKYADLRN